MINFLLLIFSIIIQTNSALKHYNLSTHLWNNEFRSGKWAYLDREPIERARNSVISNVFINMNFPNGSILDVGCGMGTLSDYINNEQRPKYLGLDISKEAVRIARTKRPGLAFKVANCESFVPRNKFDVVVFNEMLYYTDHLETMKHYIKFLSPNGIFVISIWYSKKVEYLKNSIFADADKLFPKLSLGSIQVSGTTNKQGYSMAVSSHIEAYRANPST